MKGYVSTCPLCGWDAYEFGDGIVCLNDPSHDTIPPAAAPAAAETDPAAEAADDK